MIRHINHHAKHLHHRIKRVHHHIKHIHHHIKHHRNELATHKYFYHLIIASMLISSFLTISSYASNTLETSKNILTQYCAYDVTDDSYFACGKFTQTAEDTYAATHKYFTTISNESPRAQIKHIVNFRKLLEQHTKETVGTTQSEKLLFVKALLYQIMNQQYRLLYAKHQGNTPLVIRTLGGYQTGGYQYGTHTNQPTDLLQTIIVTNTSTKPIYIDTLVFNVNKPTATILKNIILTLNDQTTSVGSDTHQKYLVSKPSYTLTPGQTIRITVSADKTEKQSIQLFVNTEKSSFLMEGKALTNTQITAIKNFSD